MRKIILFSGMLLVSFFACTKGFSLYDLWRPYSPAKIVKEPRKLTVDVIRLSEEKSQKEKLALDLGAGAGHDTAYFLKNGWRVWANDEEEESINFMANRDDIKPYKNNLTLMQKSFLDLPWDTFPQFNLIYASFSLPFVSRHNFYTVWSNVENALASGGIFAGTFFGPDHGVFSWWVNLRMTFLTKQACLDLFKNFTVLRFEEYHENNDEGYMEHVFTVIAQKN